MEDILIVENAETTDDVNKAYEQAVAENKKFFVAISKSGKRFGLVDGKVTALKDDEFALNDKFVEEEKVEEEPIAAETLDEVVENVEIVKELTNEEVEEQNLKLAQYDILVAKNQELETRNIELNDEIAKLNAQIDELTLKCELPPIEVKHEVELDEVIDFLKAHHIDTICVGE